MVSVLIFGGFSMTKHPYSAEAFRSWCIGSAATLAAIALLAAFCLGLGAGLVILVCGYALHGLFIPAYLLRRHLGYPSWVMAPSLLAISLAFFFLAAYIAPRWLYATGGFTTSILVVLFLWAPLLVWRPSRPKTILLVCCLMVAVGIPMGMRADTRGRFLHDLYRVQPGMTIEEVETIMGGYIHGTGWPSNPHASEPQQTLADLGTGRQFTAIDTPEGEITIKGARVYRHSDDGSQNADWGIVEFEEGRVVSVSFSPD